MIYYIGTVFIYLTCFFKWKMNNKKGKYKNSVVKQTMKDAYTFNRSSLIKAEKPVPKYNESKRNQKSPVELEDIEVKEKKPSKFKENAKASNKNKKKLLNKLQQKENEEKNSKDKSVNSNNEENLDDIK